MAAEDERTEEDKANELDARIKAPIVWSRWSLEDGGRGGGLRIEDLQERRFDEALALIKDHFLREEVIFKSIRFTEDEESVREFIASTRVQMKDKASLVAVDEGTGQVAAAIVLRVFDKGDFSRTFNLVKPTRGEKFAAVMRYHRELETHADVHELLKCDRYLRIFALVVHPDYRKDVVERVIESEDKRRRDAECDDEDEISVPVPLDEAMLRAAMLSAPSSGARAVAGIFASAAAQGVAERLGYATLKRVYFANYHDDGASTTPVFRDAGSGNYGAALMAAPMPVE